MTLKEINKKFLISEFKHNGKYLVYEKKAATTGRSVHKYLCSIGKKGINFFVEGCKTTGKINVLERQIKDYVKSLPYDSDYYNPRYRKGLTEELIIHDYLVSLGFKNPIYSNSQFTYELTDNNIYGFKSSDIVISIWGLDAWEGTGRDEKGNVAFNLKDKVKVVLHTGAFSWVQIETERNVEDIKKGIDSMLKPLYITDSVANLSRSTKLKNSGDVEITMNKLMESYDIGSSDFKETMKKQLQETLASLG